MQPSVFIAIDPGASGAAVIRRPSGEILEVVPHDGDESILGVVKTAQLLAWDYPGAKVPAAVIEKVWASPAMGVSASFAFGVNYGKWVMALKTAKIPVAAVTPQQWQKGSVPGITVQGAERKKALKKAAEARYPGTRVTLATCDALLLSDYALERLVAGKPLGEPL